MDGEKRNGVSIPYRVHVIFRQKNGGRKELKSGDVSFQFLIGFM